MSHYKIIMRILSSKEKQLCKQIIQNTANHFLLGELFQEDLEGQRIEIDFKEKTVKVFLLVDGVEKVALGQAVWFNADIYLNLSRNVINIVNLIQLLIKEGYVVAYNSTQSSPSLVLGTGKVVDENAFYHFPDPEVKDLIMKYASKQVIVTDEFKRFCHNGFIARDEQRFRRQIRTAYLALGIASFAALTNLGFNIHTKLFTNSSKIQQNQVDTLVKAIKLTAEKIDSLNLRMKTESNSSIKVKIR